MDVYIKHMILLIDKLEKKRQAFKNTHYFMVSYEGLLTLPTYQVSTPEHHGLGQ